MNDTTKENKMGVMPIPKLLITMSLPMVISMLVQALYNIIDSVFVAQINEEALTAVSLAFPVQNLMIAIATGTGVGINALLSRNLGEKRFKEANLAARNGIFLGVLSCIVIALLGLFGSHAFFVLQTDNTKIVTYGTQYLQIVTIASVGIFLEITLERLLQATGKTFYTMITQGTGAIINIILDPIMIFGLFGFPKMEVAGAALATVTGQIVSMILAFYFNIKRNTELDLNMRGFRPNRSIIAVIYEVGVPSIIMQSIGSVMVFGMNKILLMFSSTATAVFGVYFKLQSFVFMPVFGLNNGMVPIIAFNYGAKQRQRIMKTMKLAMMYAFGMMAIGLIIFQLFPAVLLEMFNASDAMLAIGVPALRTISISFLFAAFSIISISMLQALGHGIYSMFISVGRQLIVLVPLAYLLAQTGNLNLVWLAFPLAEIMAIVLSCIFLRKVLKSLDF